MAMLIISFFSWWYGQGWGMVAASFKRRLNAVATSYSISQLLQTLFSPWRRIISYPGSSIRDKWRAWADNFFSRSIGFVVRILVLIAAVISLLIVGLLTIIELLVWPLLPIAILLCIVKGIF